MPHSLAQPAPHTPHRARPATARLRVREIDHRTANSLQLAADFLLFEQARLADPAARGALSEAATRLAAVAQLHRFLSAHDSGLEVDLPPFLAQLAGFVAGSTGLACTVEADPLTLSGEVAQQLGIVVNELAMNAAKHAYRPGQPGPLHIEAHVEPDRLRLTVADEGRGLRGALGLPEKGLGMTIVMALVRQLNATLEATDGPGARITVTMPLAAPPRISRSFAPAGD